MNAPEPPPPEESRPLPLTLGHLLLNPGTKANELHIYLGEKVAKDETLDPEKIRRTINKLMSHAEAECADGLYDRETLDRLFESTMVSAMQKSNKRYEDSKAEEKTHPSTAAIMLVLNENTFLAVRQVLKNLPDDMRLSEKVVREAMCLGAASRKKKVLKEPTLLAYTVLRIVEAAAPEVILSEPPLMENGTRKPSIARWLDEMLDVQEAAILKKRETNPGFGTSRLALVRKLRARYPKSLLAAAASVPMSETAEAPLAPRLPSATDNASGGFGVQKSAVSAPRCG